KLRVRVRGRQVSRRCFVASGTKLILPAFGALTGGLDADHPEIVRAVGAGAEALIPVEDRLLRFPLAA
ncbi:MAG: phosphoesterase, partial [Sphingomonas sp.]